LNWLLKDDPDISVIGMFTDPRQAWDAVQSACPDAIFLDIDMPGLSGLELAQKIQNRFTGVLIVFVTAYEKYALEAYRAFPLDFLVKPVPRDRLKATVAHLRSQYALLHPPCSEKNELVIRCFGAAEFFSDRGVKFPPRG
jgi:two-component SAPR family response regulator